MMGKFSLSLKVGIRTEYLVLYGLSLPDFISVAYGFSFSSLSLPCTASCAAFFSQDAVPAAFCSCSLLWLPAGLPGRLPPLSASFRARLRSCCALRSPLPPPREPRAGPPHFPSTSHAPWTMGLALRKMRQCSKTAPPAANSGKYDGGAVFERGLQECEGRPKPRPSRTFSQA